MFEELRQGVQDITFLSDPNDGELRLGCFDPLVAGIATNVLASLAARFPKLTFEVFSGNSDGLPQMLRERQVEFVLIRAPADAPAPDFAVEPLYHEKLVIVAAAHSRWARQRKLLLTDLAQARWISSPNEFRSPGPLFQAFHAQGIPVSHPVVQSTSLVLRYNLLLRGDFVTMIPISAWRFAPPNPALRRLPVSLPQWLHPTSIVTLRDRTLSPVAELFLAELRILAAPLRGPEC